jgi:hypothetical protein
MKKVSIFFLLLIVHGCLSVKNMPDKNFISNSTEALVFGRIQIVHKDFDDTSNRNILIFNPFLSKTEEPCCDISATLIRKQVDFQDGYFFLSIPPGKYCLNHLVYSANFFPGSDIFGFVPGQFYANTIFVDDSFIFEKNLNWIFLSGNNLIFFDVLPNKANYIGTIRIEISCCYFRKCMYNQKPTKGFQFDAINLQDKKTAPFWKYTCYSPAIRANRFHIIDEKEQGYSKFKEYYPNHSDPIINLTTSMQKDWKTKHDDRYEYVDMTKYKVISLEFDIPK